MSAAVASSSYGSDVKEIRELVKEVFTDLLPQLARSTQAKTIFFPNGIELIAFKVKVGSSVEFSFAVAGEKAPKVDHLSPIVDGALVTLNDTPVEIAGARRGKEAATRSQLPVRRA